MQSCSISNTYAICINEQMRSSSAVSGTMPLLRIELKVVLKAWTSRQIRRRASVCTTRENALGDKTILQRTRSDSSPSRRTAKTLPAILEKDAYMIWKWTVVSMSTTEDLQYASMNFESSARTYDRTKLDYLPRKVKKLRQPLLRIVPVCASLDGHVVRRPPEPRDVLCDQRRTLLF